MFICVDLCGVGTVLPLRVGSRRLSLPTFFAGVGSGRLHAFFPCYNVKTKAYNLNRCGCRPTSKILKKTAPVLSKSQQWMVSVDAPLLHLIVINLTEIERGFSKMNATMTFKRNSQAIDYVSSA